MRKFLCLGILSVIALTVPFEALIGSACATEFSGIMVVAAHNNKKKTPAKKITAVKRSNPLKTKLLEKDYDEFQAICQSGSLSRFKAKMERENISPNATLKTYQSAYAEGDISTSAPEDDEWEDTLLSVAVDYSPNAEIVRFLLAKGADVNAPSYNLVHGFAETPLIRAVRDSSNVDIIKLLLNAGANARARDDFGQRPVDYARRNPKLKGTQVLRMLEAASR